LKPRYARGRDTPRKQRALSSRRRVHIPVFWCIIYKCTVAQLTCHHIAPRLSRAAWGSQICLAVKEQMSHF